MNTDDLLILGCAVAKRAEQLRGTPYATEDRIFIGLAVKHVLETVWRTDEDPFAALDEMLLLEEAVDR